MGCEFVFGGPSTCPLPGKTLQRAAVGENSVSTFGLNGRLKRHTFGLGEAIAADTRRFLTWAFVFRRKTLALDPTVDDLHRRPTLSSHAVANRKCGGATRSRHTFPKKHTAKLPVKYPSIWSTVRQ